MLISDSMHTGVNVYEDLHRKHTAQNSHALHIVLLHMIYIHLLKSNKHQNQVQKQTDVNLFQFRVWNEKCFMVYSLLSAQTELISAWWTQKHFSNMDFQLSESGSLSFVTTMDEAKTAFVLTLEGW